MSPIIKLGARFAPLCFLLGLGLLIAAWPIGLKAYGWDVGLRGILAMVYSLILFPVLLYASSARFSAAQRRRSWLVAAAFTYTMYSADSDATQGHMLHAVAIPGLLFLGFGLWHWRRALIWLDHVNRAFAPLAQHPRILLSALSLFMITTTVTLGWVIFGFMPAIPDSSAQLIHAKYMAQGMLYGPGNPLRKFFPLWLVINQDKFFAQYQPFYIAVLAIGVKLHAHWLVNPVLSAVTLWATYALANRIFTPAIALWSAVFMAFSQFVLYMASEYMNHTCSLCLLTLFMLCYVRTCDYAQAGNPARARLYGLATGLLLGFDILTRPLSALGIGFPFICHGLYRFWKTPRTYFLPFLFASLAIIASLAFQAWYNYQLTGNILVFPTMAYHANALSNAMGYKDEELTLTRIFERRQIDWSLLNQMLYQWPIPNFLPLMLYALRPSRSPYARLLLASIISMAIFNHANQFYSYLFGPRYIFDTVSGLAILTAAGFTRIPYLLSVLPHAPSLPQLKAALHSLCLLLFAIAFAERLPLFVNEYYHHYVDNNADFYRSALRQSTPPALIFLGHNGAEPKDSTNWGKDYRIFSSTYPPSDSDERIFATDLGEKKNQELISRYPGRNIYIENNGILEWYIPSNKAPSKTSKNSK